MDPYHHSYPPPPSSFPNSPGQQPAFQPYSHAPLHHHQPSPYYDQTTPAPNPPAGASPTYPSSVSPGPAPTSNENPELKRVRNTAASARFRAKKKRREQALEESSRETREMLAKLEERIRDLEAENRFLKGLIFDKEKLEGVRQELEHVRALKRELEGQGGAEGEAGDDGRGDG